MLKSPKWHNRLLLLRDFALACYREPETARMALPFWKAMRDGMRFAQNWPPPVRPGRSEYKLSADTVSANPFMDWFTNHHQGHQVWKWQHYFEVYPRHLAHLVGQPVTVVEIGVLGGGSLEMWATCFGPRCNVYGIDIDPHCQQYEAERIAVVTGDQQDRQFWAAFKSRVPVVDVIIDDGGHKYEQQKVTLEEMLPHLQPGGVYICEDVHRSHNLFAQYSAGLVAQLNRMETVSRMATGAGVKRSAYQQAVHSIHFYPYLLVIENQRQIVSDMVSQKRGQYNSEQEEAAT